MVAPLVMMGLSLGASVVQGLAGGAGSAQGAKPGAPEKMRRTAEDFESMFLEQALDRMLAESNETEEEGPLASGGPGSGVYKSMLAKEYAGSIVRSGGVGIANSVYAQMLKMQEGSDAGR
jgi:peptidoglycan hydrolase FlgJ